MRLHLHPVRNEAVTVEDGALRRWELSNLAAQILDTRNLPRGGDTELFGGIWDSALSPHGDRLGLATSSAGSGIIELRAWTTLEVVERVENVPDVHGFTTLAFSPDRKWIAAADSEERILLLERATLAVVSEIETGLTYTSSLAFHPNSRRLAAFSTDQGGGTLSLIQVREGKLQLLHEDL